MGDCWPVAQVLLCLAVQPLLLDGLDNPHQQPAAGLALAASRQHLAAGLVEGVVSQLLLAGSVAQPLRAAAAAGATAGGLFGGLFGGGEEKASSSQPRAAEGTGDGGEGEGFDLEDELGMDLGDEEGCEQQ